MIVTLKDGSKKEYAEAKSVIDIAYDMWTLSFRQDRLKC